MKPPLDTSQSPTHISLISEPKGSRSVAKSKNNEDLLDVRTKDKKATKKQDLNKTQGHFANITGATAISIVKNVINKGSTKNKTFYDNMLKLNTTLRDEPLKTAKLPATVRQRAKNSNQNSLEAFSP